MYGILHYLISIIKLEQNQSIKNNFTSTMQATLKLSHESIFKSQKLLFENYLQTRMFPDQRKKASIVPIYKKGDKQLVKNYSFLTPNLRQSIWTYHFLWFIKILQKSNLLCPHKCVQQLVVTLTRYIKPMIAAHS